MKIAILTMFNGLSSTYSLVNVVAEQLKMLLEDGVKVKLLVSEDCNDADRSGIFADSRIEWIKICNRYKNQVLQWRDYSNPNIKVHDTIDEEAGLIAKDYIKYLEDVDVCMMHDIHYQGWHLVHNLAIRMAAKELPKLHFLAFTHSIPDVSQVGRTVEGVHAARYTPMERTIYCYPTESGCHALAKQYQVSSLLCKPIPNSIYLLETMPEEIQKIQSQIDILSSDILIVYPARFTVAKKFEKVAKLAGALKKVNHVNVKVVFCEFQAMDTNGERYRKQIREEGTMAGLMDEDMIFMYEMGYPNGISRAAVLSLFTLSNLFLTPSFSESFGLTVLEAASRGNFLVLNQAVPALLELGEKLDAYFLRWDARNFGFDTKETYHPSERLYYEEHAKIIYDLMRENPVLNAKTLVRQQYSPEFIYKIYLKPLLTEKTSNKTNA